MYTFRSLYYKLLNKFSDFEQIEHFTGFGLYDASFVQTLRELKDPTPFLRGIVAELGPERKEIAYTQQQRRAGKTKIISFRLYDLAMLSFYLYDNRVTSCNFYRIYLSILSLFVAFLYLVLKLINWFTFPHGAGAYFNWRICVWFASTVFHRVDWRIYHSNEQTFNESSVELWKKKE